jgi:dipeptidyl-peptidase-4
MVGAGGFKQLTATAEAERDPKLSPDGSRVSFRREHDLYTMEIATGKVARLTQDGSATLLNGELDWVYPEELDIDTAYWWSPDGGSLAFLQFDVSREPLYPHADLLGLKARAEPQRYPKAGDPNPDVQLGVVAAGGGRARWMDLGPTRDTLLARVAWTPDSRSLIVHRLSRVQDRLELIGAEAQSGATRVVLREADPYWINLHDQLRFLKDGKEFLLTSERDGWAHLYRYSIDGKLLAQLTKGEWEVSAVAGVDEARGQVYFASTEQSPLERHLYRVALDGGERRRLTKAAGSHSISMGPSCEYYLDTASSLSSPPRQALHSSDGSELAVLWEYDRKPLEDYEVLPSEIVEVKGSDGTRFFARLMKPAGFRSGQKYPAVVSVYGGPGAQAVRDAWRGLSLDQVLAHRGFVFWQLDNRGSAGRGHKWESALYRRLGAQELADQKEGVRHLVSMGFVDPARVGIHGSSYGGFMTITALLGAPEVFRAGAAGAPVTDWRHYDTIYTERYLGLPSDNAEGYRLSSPVNFAEKLAGKLLLFHNIEDDNVHFHNTLRMADALQRVGKQFEMMVYPQKSHGITGAASRHMQEAVVAFFERTLKPQMNADERR